MPTFNSPEDADNELTRLLLRAVPENKHGNKTISHLAVLMECTRATIFNWVKDGRMPAPRAAKVVEVSKIVGYDLKGEPILGEPRVTIDEFHKFVYVS